jgi:hypothetical protein
MGCRKIKKLMTTKFSTPERFTFALHPKHILDQATSIKSKVWQ